MKIFWWSLLYFRLITNPDPNAPGMLQILTTLESLVVDRSNDSAMVSLATAIKPRFVKMFVAFGDYLTPFSKDMIAMEQAYIPALYCSNSPVINGTPDPQCEDASGDTLQGTINYVSTLQARYNEFASHYPILGTSLNMPATLNWTTQLGDIQSALTSAQTKLQTAKDNSQTVADAKAAGAHDDLEEISAHLFDLRHDYESHPFVIDALTSYHSLFGPLMAVVNDPQGVKTELTADEVGTIKAMTPDLQDAFATMQAATQAIKSTDYGMADLNQLNQLLSVQAGNLANLLSLLADYGVSNDNSADIAVAAVNVQKTYVPFFRSFGMF